MKKKVIFWDFDGVITDSMSFVFDYWKQEMLKLNINFTHENLENSFKSRFPFEYLEETFGEKAKIVTNKYSEYEKKYYSQKVMLFPEMFQIIEDLSKNYDFFIISSNLEFVIKETLKKNNLLDYFTEIKGRETIGYKSDKIQKILKKYNYRKDLCIFIGDASGDIHEAKKAKISSIAVTWGIHKKNYLKLQKPDFLLENPDDLMKIL